MLRAGVTVACAAAMAGAAVLVIRLRGTTRTPSPLSGNEPFGERLSVTAGRVGGMLVGAYVTGVLAIGAGARLMMRLLAATSSDDVQGLRTEADEVIGRVTVGGSLILVVAVGIAAALVGLTLFSALRRWLPDRSLAAGLIGVAIGAGGLVRPVGFIAADNNDFKVVAPVALAVALAIGSLVLFGATLGVLVDTLAPRWPRPAWSVRGVLALAPFAVLVVVPPLVVAAAASVLFGAVAARLRPVTAPTVQPIVEGARSRVGRTLVLALGGIGTLSVLAAAGEVLAL